VPQNLPTGSGWYPQLANNLPDSFYKVDLNSGQVSLLAEPVGNQPFYSATSVYLSPDGKILYFQDRSGSVYSLGLP
jgi:sugar lactone lactonase YvrE